MNTEDPLSKYKYTHCVLYNAITEAIMELETLEDNPVLEEAQDETEIVLIGRKLNETPLAARQ